MKAFASVLLGVLALGPLPHGGELRISEADLVTSLVTQTAVILDQTDRLRAATPV